MTNKEFDPIHNVPNKEQWIKMSKEEKEAYHQKEIEYLYESDDYDSAQYSR